MGESGAVAFGEGSVEIGEIGPWKSLRLPTVIKKKKKKINEVNTDLKGLNEI